VTVGVTTDKKLVEGESVYVSTGAMIPDGTDGVVMQEYARPVTDAVEITKSVRKGENICFRGEDVKEGQTVLEKGKRLSPFDLGVLAALGITRIPVFRLPQIGLASSGDEIVPAETVPAPGKIRDINTYTITGLLQQQGCAIRFGGIAADTVESITEKLSGLRECAVVLLSGGSSKGQSDFMTTAIEGLGGTILFHGLNIKPGKPTIFADLAGQPVFGLPGHPVSCSMAVIRFVFPLLARLKGEEPRISGRLTGSLTTNIPSSYGIEEYVRVAARKEGQRFSVTPLFAKSSVISILSRADGYIIVPEGKEGLEKGEEVEVFPLG
jgi:molybdopterin molybdotransferase